MASIRGPGAPNTTPETCRYVTPRFLADAYVVCTLRSRWLPLLRAEGPSARFAPTSS